MYIYVYVFFIFFVFVIKIDNITYDIYNIVCK
jgi:hypothetical protein